MTGRPSVYSRIQRRETHASRATSAIIVATLAILALVYLVAEIVLAAFGQRPLLLSPARMVQDIARLNTVAIVWLVVAAVVLAVLGIVLLITALSAGRRARHVIDDDRAVVVVDNEVIASALVRTAAESGDVNPDRAVGHVGHRIAVLRITPSSGVQIDRGAITTALSEQLNGWALKPRLRPRVQIQRGKVGA